jgi:hypothetical protein
MADFASIYNFPCSLHLHPYLGHHREYQQKDINSILEGSHFGNKAFTTSPY